MFDSNSQPRPYCSKSRAISSKTPISPSNRISAAGNIELHIGVICARSAASNFLRRQDNVRRLVGFFPGARKPRRQWQRSRAAHLMSRESPREIRLAREDNTSPLDGQFMPLLVAQGPTHRSRGVLVVGRSARRQLVFASCSETGQPLLVTGYICSRGGQRAYGRCDESSGC